MGTASEIPIVFKSVDSILNVLSEYKKEPNVSELLEIYYSKKLNSSDFTDSKKYPLIVLEGLDASGKTTLSQELAKARNAKLWNTPPACTYHLRSTFENNAILRTSFYSLGNYIAAEELKLLLKDSPVVLDRFWHSTTTYALAQQTHKSNGDFNLPPEGDDIYEWPDDLLKPDIVMYLDVSEPMRLERISRRKNVTEQESLLKSNVEFRKNILTAYERMRNPGIVKINSNVSIKMVLEELLEKTNHLF